MERTITRIENRVSMTALEQALVAALDGEATTDYFMQLALMSSKGENRAKKSVSMLNRLTVKNPLMPTLLEHKDDVKALVRSKMDRPLLLVALMSAAWIYCYDLLSLMGKYLHAQPTVSRAFLLQKMGEKYGSNRTLYISFGSLSQMLMEAGFVKRTGVGVYELVRQEKYSDLARDIYRQSFLIHNPMLTQDDDVEGNPYFEFIR